MNICCIICYRSSYLTIYITYPRSEKGMIVLSLMLIENYVALMMYESIKQM